MRRCFVVSLSALALSTQALVAQPVDSSMHNRYRWKDTHGVVQYSDTLPAEALQLGYDVLDAQGMVVRHTDRAKTAEERKADAAAAAAQAEVNQRAAEAAKADQQLLVAYTSEEDLAAAQQAKLDAVDQTVANVRVSQADQEKALSEQLAHAATFERDNKPVPALVQQQIEALRKNIETQKTFIEHKQSERAAIAQKSIAELAHYRELRAKQKPSP
jgi:hypothetical protein